MLTRRRLLAVALVLVLGTTVVALSVRDDEAGRESVDAIDGTTSTTRRRATTTTATSTSTTVASTSTAPATTGSTVRPSTRPRSTTSTPGTDPPPAPAPAVGNLAAARIQLTPVASLTYPIAMAVFPGDGSLWIALKGGTVCRLSGSSCTNARQVATVSTGGEQGLLGITYHPSGSLFYASYTDDQGDTRVDAFAVGAAGEPVGSATPLYFQDQPADNHNGGNILFGPDGYLYLGLGDGGSAGDPWNNAQNPGTDLGKVLRLDPGSGAVVAHQVSGVRNPWRFSFDRATGDLWIADVGQNEWEEVDFLPAGTPAGSNLGWRCYEGTHAYEGCAPAGGHTGPVFEYSHSEGCSVTGGYVYRGSRIPDLVGAYLFADYCDGEVRAITQAGGQLTGARRLGVDPGNVVSFGQDAAGELYVLTPTTVLRVDPA